MTTEMSHAGASPLSALVRPAASPEYARASVAPGGSMAPGGGRHSRRHWPDEKFQSRTWRTWVNSLLSRAVPGARGSPRYCSLSTHCSLLTAHCSQLAARCSLRTHCLLLATYCSLLTSDLLSAHHAVLSSGDQPTARCVECQGRRLRRRRLEGVWR